MRFQQWNDAIASRFFNPEMKDRRIFLYITPELIKSIGVQFDSDEKDFVSVIHEGPEDAKDIGICAQAERSFRNWRRKKLSYPPYIAYLAFFAMAAGLGGDFVAHAYYPRLRQLLGETPSPGTYPGFSKMRALWEDLETWSQRDKRGEFGLFQVSITTRLIHVGIPISQTILSDGERQALPRLFAVSGLDAASMPSEILLAQSIRDNDEGSLRPRTRKILNEPSLYPEDYQALTEALFQELSAWDGTVNEGTESQKKSAIYGVVKLSCRNIDLVSGRVDFRFLCRTKHEFPEDELLLKLEGGQESYKCREFRSGWSTPLEDESGNELDASSFPWCVGLRLREMSRGWRFSLGTSPVRVLVDAGGEGLEGFIEIQNLPAKSSFFIIAESHYWRIIELWGTSACSGFEEINVLSGLPYNWRLFR